MTIPGVRGFQAEETANAKAMRQRPGVFTEQQSQCDWSKPNVGGQWKGERKVK